MKFTVTFIRSSTAKRESAARCDAVEVAGGIRRVETAQLVLIEEVRCVRRPGPSAKNRQNANRVFLRWNRREFLGKKLSL